VNPFDRYQLLDLQQLLKELGAAKGSIQGLDEIRVLENLIQVRTAEMVSRQLSETAGSIGRSANLMKDALEHSTLTAKTTLENSSGFLIAALKVNTETGSKNAQEIKEQIAGLRSSLAEASTDLRKASAQSTSLATRLNWLTAVVALAAVLTAGATIFYAVETKRLVDVTAQQLQSAAQRASSPAPKDK
jgi:hypothetical protein